MNDDELEKMLREQPLAEPSELHEQRMDKLFDDTRKSNKTPARRWSLRPWQAVASAVLCVGIGYGMSFVPDLAEEPAATPAEPATVYIIESPEYPTFRPRPALASSFWDDPPEPRVSVRDAKGNPEVVTIVVNQSKNGGIK